MHYRAVRIILVIFLLISMTGCVDLSSYDLAGQVEVERKSDGFAYRQIYGFSKWGNESSDFFPEDDPGFIGIVFDVFSSALLGSGDYIALSDLYLLLEFTEGIRVNQDIYTVKVSFRERPPQDINYLKIVNAEGKEVPFTVIAQKNYVDGDRVNLEDDYPARQEGSALVSFIEPASGEEYLLEVKYSLEADPAREDEKSTAEVRIEISSHIGYSRYYQGLYPLSKERTVDVYLLDWNLDGAFTAEDWVWIDHGKKKFLPINEKFKLGKGKKEKEYIITLKPGDDEGEKFVLNIERTDE